MEKICQIAGVGNTGRITTAGMGVDKLPHEAWRSVVRRERVRDWRVEDEARNDASASRDATNVMSKIEIDSVLS